MLGVMEQDGRQGLPTDGTRVQGRTLEREAAGPLAHSWQGRERLAAVPLQQASLKSLVPRVPPVPCTDKAASRGQMSAGCLPRLMSTDPNMGTFSCHVSLSNQRETGVGEAGYQWAR